jgi:glycerol-3-phosphate O-acyltransferase
MEVRSYQTELRGKAKVSESFGSLMRARRIFKTKFGKAYIGFGEPINLDQYLEQKRPGWKEEVAAEDSKPKWLHPLVVDLAKESLTRVNTAAVVSPVAIFSLVILASPQRAMSEEELLMLMDRFLRAMRAAPYGKDVELPEGDAKSLLQHCMQVCKVERFQHPGGDVIYLDEREGVLLTYYRNNILHLLALPALLASFFQHNDRILESQLLDGSAQLYPFLKEEFFLRFADVDSRKVLGNVLEALIKEGLLVRIADAGAAAGGGSAVIARPDLTSPEFTCLKALGRTLGQTLERYAISTALLAKNSRSGQVNRKEFESQCQLMAQRISILNGHNEPEYFDKTLFRTYIDLLKNLGYVLEDEKGQLTVDAQLNDVAKNSLGLLSVDIRQSIERIALSYPKTI